jgi:hypothetical protein
LVERERLLKGWCLREFADALNMRGKKKAMG